MNKPTNFPPVDNYSESAASSAGADRYPADKTIVDLFAEQVRLTPANVAVSYEAAQITYRELDEKSTQLAHHLRACGVEPETLVPICLNRSINMIIGTLGILKAGGVYVPVDPDYPTDRISYVLTDTAARVVVADSYAVSRLPVLVGEVVLVCIDRDWNVIGRESTEAVPTPITPASLAYVIYTSGSTGRPKGVLIEHRNVVRLFKTESPLFDFTDRDVWTMFHSFCFDFSVWEMYGALFYGGRLIVVPRATTKDTASFGDLLIKQGVTVLNQTPSAFYVLQDYLTSHAATVPLRYVIFGGEALTPARLKPWHESFADCRLINMYGITETTVHVTYQPIGPAQIGSVSSIIGTPIPTLTTYILDEARQRVPAGVTGELYVGGAGLARGYLNLPELTADRFINHSFGDAQARLYRSGDLARQLPDGSLEYLGRIDEQVKIRGYRIELGEIESVLLRAPGVRQCVVVAKEDAGGEKRLVGYIVPEGPFDRDPITRLLQETLPDYMVPWLLLELDHIPLTGNGKVDKKRLPAPDASALLTGSYVAPTTRTEEKVSGVWQAVLTVTKVGINDNFFELGGNSLLAARAVASLNQQYGYALPITRLYQFPTVNGLSAFLDGRRKDQPVLSTVKPPAMHTADIAVIGMAGRFPGASTIDELWTVLKEGRETVSFFSTDELDSQLPGSLINDPAYVKARGIVEDADQFDAAFFGLNPRLAEVMDPQQRLFMEIAWEALEKTGHLPQHYEGRVGIYAGCGNNTYYLNNVLRNQQVLNQVGSFQAMTVNEKDFIASRTAYQLNLKGPAVSVFSACSSSLLAITQAVDSIRTGQCDVALAGGASVTAPINSGHLYEEGAMLSRDGHSRSFDAAARGTVFSDGAGVVLLKSLGAAQRDGDTVYAVIKGYGVTNDGGGKGSFTAPNAEGQAAAIRMAIDTARIDPSTISYVEAHGTATPVGDPIEIEGLQMAFGDCSATQFCAIGSIKSNLGHLTAAAGVAGFIKTALALYHRQLPPSLGFTTPNPVINFADSPFFVNTALTDWPPENAPYNGPRRAGVSSFGVGGTNVHVVLEENKDTVPPSATGPDEVSAGRPVQLVTWSAKSAFSLGAYATRLTDYVRQSHQPALADVAFTLQTTRADFTHRRFVVASTGAEFSEAAASPMLPGPLARPDVARPGEVVFLFPGQGAQYLNMGRDLYEHEPVYRQAVDDCAALLHPYLETDIRQIMYPDAVNSGAKERLKNTRFTQPALFVTEYALACLWINWGIEPTVFCGHSIGEFVGAHLAGVFSLADALKLVAARGRMVGELPRGSMLSVRLNATGVEAVLPENLSIAAINSLKLCVVAGPDEDIAAFARQLDEQGIPNRVLETSHAFHSAMMDPIVADFENVVRSVSLHRPVKPIVSTVTGTWLSDHQATDPHYWATHLRLTVRFAEAVTTLVGQPHPLLLEVGPGTVTATLARQHSEARQATILASLEVGKAEQTEYYAVLKTLGHLWVAGLAPNWPAFYANQKRSKLELPTYVFDKKRCWVDPVVDVVSPYTAVAAAQESPVAAFTSEPLSHPMISMRKDSLLASLKTILEDASGVDMAGITPAMNFMEIGLDSLSLTQLAITFKREFGLPVSFRQLNEEYATLDKLADYLDKSLPAESRQPPQPVAVPQPAPVALPAHNGTAAHTGSPIATGGLPMAADQPMGDSALGLIAQQLQLLAKQVALLQGYAPTPPAPVPPAAPAPVFRTAATAVATTASPVPADLTAEEALEIRKPFGAIARIERQGTGLTQTQQQFLRQLTERYTRKTATSKAYAQQHRPHMADPRVVTGFNPITKELVYPLVVNKSKGSRLWDLDGNEYIDVLNGFGSTMFGYQPDMIKNALHQQLDQGYEVGPQHELAGEVSQLICEFTGFDRAALCNTGSEAVLGTMRIARTVTGRSLIVAFTGSYHGIMDEVLVRGTKKLTSYPAAPGILPGAVQNMLILEYGTDESLRIIRERAHELAAVLVEPVQSRRPEFRPVEFLKQVRAITEATGTALIFDEVITGFRMHPGGTQALFGIKADIAAYGKVIGGGLPIGAIAGKKAFMDVLDGGFWQYGDASYPEVGVTFFAGTFVRHPLALAAANASLQYMKDRGPGLQQALTAKAERLADTLNAVFERQQRPFFVAQFGSLWKIKFTQDIPHSELLFTLMREKGVHVWDGFPCFMTDAHTTDEVDRVCRLFIESVEEMTEAGFFTATHPVAVNQTKAAAVLNQPPAPGAKLGRDKNGNPAWFIENPSLPGKYLQVELS